MKNNGNGSSGLESSWMVEDDAVVIFTKPIAYEDACTLSDDSMTAGGLFVVETILWTADEDKTFKLKRFVCGSFKSVLVYAMALAVNFCQMSEEVIGIRKCTAEEYETYKRVAYYLACHADVDFLPHDRAKDLPPVD